MKTKNLMLAILIMVGSLGFVKAQIQFNANNIPSHNQITTHGLIGGDFNEDGKMDIVKVDETDTIGVYLGNNTGILDSIIKVHVPINATSLACADFNQDGHKDLIICTWHLDSIGIIYGDGHGGFSSIHNIYKSSIAIEAIYAPDFNNDGFPDLVFVLGQTLSVKILLNDTHGNFILSPDVTCIGSSGYNVDALTTDVNGDNKIDLVILNMGNDKLCTFLGNGDGTFGNEITISLPIGSNPISAVSADFNGDGKMDLAVANYSTDNITPLFGNNDGTFNVQPIFAIGKHLYNLITADFNNDGKSDIMSCNYGGNSISFFSGNGNGTFINDTIVYISNPLHAISGDFNGDNKSDVAFISFSGNMITVLTNTSPMIAPKICIITEDTTHTYNVIAWEKTNMYLTNIDSFIVYREIGTNNYQRIGAVSKDSMSTFTDMNVNPNSTSYRYKIRSKNTIDISHFSNYHNTIFLTNNGATFNWTPYSVENNITPVSVYNIYRDDNSTNNFNIIGFTSGTQFGYTDVNFSSFPNARYYVEAVLTAGDCHPTRSAFNGSTSNIIHNNTTTTVKEFNKSSINVFPNPATNVLNITGINSKTIVFLYDVVGNLVLEKETENNVVLNIEQFSKGIYIVKVENSINKIIIQ